VVLLLALVLRHLVLLHQFVDGLEGAALLVQLVEPLLELVAALPRKGPYLVLVYELDLSR
jgi:hypothetical protein